MSQAILDPQTKEWLSSVDVVPREIEVRSRRYYPQRFASHGFKGVVWKGKDEYNGDVAIKFTESTDYMQRSYLAEASRARQLRNTEVFADFLDAGVVELDLPNQKKQTFVCFVEEWVEGWPLPDYLRVSVATPSFFLAYVAGIFEALNILKVNALRHDDLRPANVMIARPREGRFSEFEVRVKVVDTGSLKSASEPSEKAKDDHRWATEHLVMIYNSIKSRRNLTLLERRFLVELLPILERMLEEDRIVALVEPAKVVENFGHAWIRALRRTTGKHPELLDPFDYISAEHIASDQLLIHLFAESTPWFKDVSGPNPVLLTGPRGCGKSMVFRRLSLRALLYKNVRAIQRSQIAGFYISCSADLRNRLGWINTEILAQRLRLGIVHYFNLLLLREILETLSFIARRADREKLFGFSRREEVALHRYLMEKLGIEDLERLRLQGVPEISHALETVQLKLEVCYSALLDGRVIDRPTDATFLADLSKFLSDTVRYFNEKKLAFLVDDFSTHRVPEPVQEVLNSIIWDRQPFHVFKISAEKHGAIGLDRLRSSAEMTRELREIDCGQVYMLLKPRERRRFARDLLAKRLQLARYKGGPEELLGESKYEEGTLGRALRARSKKKGRIDDQYHGLETLAELCTGDISVLLELYRRIFIRGKVDKSTTLPVPSVIQHSAVESVARELLDVLRAYHPRGREMYSIVNAFGQLSRRILREGYEEKHGDSFRPCETTRIEVDQRPESPGEELSEDHQDLMRQLLRRAVFIELEMGRSRHGFTPSVRWQLRRVFCPAFGASPFKTTAVKWTPAQFKWFLAAPKEACAQEFNLRWKEDRTKATRTSSQQPLPLSVAQVPSGPSASHRRRSRRRRKEAKDGAKE